MACPECGTSLRLQLSAAHYVPQPVGPAAERLRPAASPEPPAETIPNFEDSIRSHKRELLGRALSENNGVMTRAAKSLGLKYTTFVAMVHRLGLIEDDLHQQEG